MTKTEFIADVAVSGLITFEGLPLSDYMAILGILEGRGALAKPEAAAVPARPAAKAEEPAVPAKPERPEPDESPALDRVYTVPEAIKRLRKVWRLTQAEFAEKIHYSRQIIGFWESGAVVPSIDAIKVICDTYGLDTLSGLTERDFRYMEDHKEEFIPAEPGERDDEETEEG